MFVRIASAAVGIPLAALIVFGWGGALLPSVVGILAIIGVHEFYRGVRRLGMQPAEWAGWVACIVFIIVRAQYDAPHGVFPLYQIAHFATTILAIVFLAALILDLRKPGRAPIRNIGATALGAFYAGWLMSYLIPLRQFDIGPQFHPPLKGLAIGWLDTHSYGAWLILFLLLVTWACDTGAYFAGRAFGKRKLAPAISPGKTVEGAIGGVVGSIVVALLAGGLAGFPMWARPGIGIVIAAASMVGDLVESAMKREIGIKDFGAIMPGHGGVLDRLDSLLFSAPVLYHIMWVCFLTGVFGYGPR